MRVLVLGADGFVGRKVVAALDAAEWAVPVAGTRRSIAHSSRIERRRVDATDAASLATALDGIDALVNCVAGDAATIIANAEAIAATAGDRHVVHMSSMAVYGSATGRLAEDAPLLADTGPYAAAKTTAEQRVRTVPHLAILRPGCIYGAGSTQWSLRIARLLAARRIGDLGAGGDGCSNIVHGDDVTAAILAVLRNSVHGTFNLAMTDAPDWNGYFLAFARALGTVPVRRVPAWQLRMESAAAIPLKLAERATRIAPPPIAPWLTAFWRRDVTLDSSRATQQLAIRWTPLDRGVADAAAYCATRLRRPTAS